MDVNSMNFHNSRKAFFFTGAVAILLVLLIASTMTWVAVSNARSERAPLMTQGQQVQSLKQSILNYPRVLQVASEKALYNTNLRIYERGLAQTGPPYPDPRYLCAYIHYPNLNPPPIDPNYPNPLCYDDPNNPADNGNRDNVVRYYFCDNLTAMLYNWSSEITALGNDMGIEVSITPASPSCSLEMETYRIVKVAYGGAYELKDKATGQLLSSGYLSGEAHVDINGFEDPAIWALTRLLSPTGKGVMKNIYFSEKTNDPGIDVFRSGTRPDQLAVNQLTAKAARGKGWFYGKTTLLPATDPLCMDNDPINNPLGNPKRCIAVIANVPADVSILEKYAGVILLKEPIIADSVVDCDPLGGGDLHTLHTETGDCLDCLRYLDGGNMDPASCPGQSLGPYMNLIYVSFIAVNPDEVISFLDINNVGNSYLIGSRDYPPYSGKMQNSVASSGNIKGIWDIEKLRAMSVCGFYVNNEDAPDFLNRMIIGGEKTAEQHGIETFLLGTGVNYLWNHDPSGAPVLITGEEGIYSNVDHMYLRQLTEKYQSGDPGSYVADAWRMKGLPGCRQIDQCSYDTFGGQNSPIGHFAMDESHLGVVSNPLDPYAYDSARILQCNLNPLTPGYYASCDTW